MLITATAEQDTEPGGAPHPWLRGRAPLARLSDGP